MVHISGCFVPFVTSTLLGTTALTQPIQTTRQVCCLNAINSAHDKPTSSSTGTIDWKLYNLKQQFKKSGGTLYKPSLLSNREYNSIINELSELNLQIDEEKESSFATKRMGCTVGCDTDIYRILSCAEGSLCKLLNVLESDEDGCGRLILAPDIPVEVCPLLLFTITFLCW
jgi:hypothetical protein